MDVGACGTLGTRRGRLLSGLADWLEEALGARPRDLARYERALTHGSRSAESYERLEFLGDRVLGLAIAEWLYERFPQEPEGALSRRLHVLVAGPTCAIVARAVGVPAHLKLGKQARDYGADDSDNVLGDVAEALIGALHLDHGYDAARAFVRRHWAPLLEEPLAAPRHPKSELQEWASAQRRRTPDYAIVERSGPDHAPRFVVRVSIGSFAHADGTGTSKQEAETAAARALLERLQS